VGYLLILSMNRQNIFSNENAKKVIIQKSRGGEDPVSRFTSRSFRSTPFFLIRFVSQAMWSIRRSCCSGISNPSRYMLIRLERLGADSKTRFDYYLSFFLLTCTLKAASKNTIFLSGILSISSRSCK